MTAIITPKQSIVRFQDRSYVLPTTDARCLLESLSHRTGWPTDRLQITSDHSSFGYGLSRNSATTTPFVQVRVISGIRGGKGGFGTLLKGQSRQAGAKTTTHFGACRDLQGRRLRHVNQAVEQKIWQEWKDKVAAGTASSAEMAHALLNTKSGVTGWHLQLPAWADVSSKKEQRQWKRQFHQWKREQQALKQQQEKARQWQERQVQDYVDAAQNVSAAVEASLETALQAGLQRPKKRAKVVEKDEKSSTAEPPPALITLTGDIVLASQDGRWQVQSQANFSTMGAVLKKEPSVTTLYYEIVVITGGLVQVGWATPAFVPSSEKGDGVGDCAHSWGYDGSRAIRLHGSGEVEDDSDNGQPYGTDPGEWKAKDVVGCLYNIQTGEISFELNGKSLGVAFAVADKEQQLQPALSANQGEIVELRWQASEMMYQPAGSTAVAELFQEKQENDDDDEGEAKAGARMTSATKPEAKLVAKDNMNPGGENDDKQITESAAHAEKTAAEPVVEIEPLENLTEYKSPQELERLGLDRLKGALMAMGVKCGGTLNERAIRLFSLKDLDPEDYPKKLLAKKKKKT